MIKAKNQKKEMLDSIMKESILNAAIETLQKFGAKGMTMDKVALDAKIAKGTVYLYFKDKDELLKELVNKIKEPIIKEMILIKESKLPVAEKIEKIFFYMLNDIEQKLSFVKVLMRAIDAREQLKAFLRKDDEASIEIFAEILKDGIKNGEIIMDNPDYAAKIIFACLMFMIRERAEGSGKFMPVKKEKNNLLGHVKIF